MSNTRFDVQIFLVVFFVALLLISCASKDKAPTTVINEGDTIVVTVPDEEPTQSYLMNCNLKWNDEKLTAMSSLGFQFMGFVDSPDESQDVYEFELPGYYPPQPLTGWTWANCPDDFTPQGLKAYGDKLCRLGYDQNSKQPRKYQRCLNRGEKWITKFPPLWDCLPAP